MSAQTHPEALVSKLARRITDHHSGSDIPSIPDDYELARFLLDLFEVREEQGIDPARPYSEHLSAMSMRAAQSKFGGDIPDFAKPTHHRYTLTTDWEEVK